MITSQLTQRLAKDHGLTQRQARDITNDVISHVTDALAQGDTVRLNDFGTLSVVRTKERKLSDAMGGGIAPARNRVKFKPAKAIKEAVNADQ